MKICLFGIPELKPGRINLKDPRLDEADRMVEAKKKVYAQVDTVDEKELLTSDAVLTNLDGKLELIFKDLEFIETRLGRDAQEPEKSVLLKIKAALESDKLLIETGLSAEDTQAVVAHAFHTAKPIIVATAAELADPDPLMLRAVAEAGFISFLTVGGKENRAWIIRKGMTAWEAAGQIHSDIQKGFIRAEIINYADFAAAGGETEAKRLGKQRLETKTYIMQDFDLTNFRSGK